MKYLVEATDLYQKNNKWDSELSIIRDIKKYKPKAGEQWEVSEDRKDYLVELGYVKEVKKVKAVKTTRKTTKKAKE